MLIHALYMTFFFAGVATLAYIWLQLQQGDRTPAVRLFGYVILAMLGITALQFLELFFPALEAKILFLNMRLTLYKLIPPLLLLFVFDYTGKKRPFPPRYGWLLWVEPALVSLLAFTSPWHELFRYDYALAPAPFDPDMLLLTFARGPLFYAQLGYSFLLGGYILAVWLSAYQEKLIRASELATTLTATAIPVTAEMLFNSGLTGFNYGPISNALAACVYWLGLFRYKLFSLKPMAYELVMNNLADLVLLFDNQQRLAGFNAAAVSQLGLDAQALGRPMGDLPAAWVKLLTPYANGQAPDKETAVTAAFEAALDLEGEAREFQVRVESVLDNQDHQRGRLFILEDITERKRAETQIMAQQINLAVSQERAELARNLHDNLGQVIGYIDLQSQTIQTLLRQGERQQALAELAEIQKAAQDVQADIRRHILGLRSDEPPADFLATIGAYLQEFARAQGVQTVWQKPDEPFKLETTVENQALLVLQEALANIRKHAQAQRVEVLLTRSGAEALLLIADNGVGFDLDDAPGAVTGHFGLQMMRERLEQAGGRLEIFSRPNEGTRLALHLPLPTAESSHESDQNGLTGVRVLLADDHALFREGLRNLLTTRGMKVVALASNGREALELAQIHQPEVIILDLNMPLMDGVEATRAITAVLPDTPILILTVSEDHSNLLEAIRAGAAGYLLKNLEADRFCALLADLARGETVISPSLAGQILQEVSRSTAPAAHVEESLTDRQLEILRLVAEGRLTYKEIGQTLNLSERTIKYHMKQIMEALRVENRSQLIAYAQKMKA